MNGFIVLLVFFLTTIFGYGVLSLFKLKEDFLFKLCLSFGLGFGSIGILMFVYSLFGVPWNFLTLILPLCIFTYFFWKIGKPIAVIKLSLPKERVLTFLILLLIGFVFFESLIRPLSSWDGWSSWQARAKVYFIDGKVNPGSFNYLETDYPPLVPLYSAFVYESIGMIDDTSILFISALLYLLIGICSYSYVRSKTGSRYALVITFLILSTQNLIRHGGRFEAGMADIVLAFYILLTVTLLDKFMQTKKREVLIILYFIMGMTALIKNEGLLFSLITFFALMYFLWQEKLSRLFVFSFFYITPVILWTLYKYINTFSFGILSASPKVSPINLLDITKVFLIQYANIQNWNLGWIFSFFVYLYAFYKKRLGLPLFILLVQNISYMVVFLFTYVDPSLHATGISDRLLLQIFPSVITFAGVNIYPEIKKSGLLERLRLL